MTSWGADTEIRSSWEKTADFCRGFRQLLKHECHSDRHVTSDRLWRTERERERDTLASKHLNLKLTQSRYNFFSILVILILRKAGEWKRGGQSIPTSWVMRSNTSGSIARINLSQKSLKTF